MTDPEKAPAENPQRSRQQLEKLFVKGHTEDNLAKLRETLDYEWVSPETEGMKEYTTLATEGLAEKLAKADQMAVEVFDKFKDLGKDGITQEQAEQLTGKFIEAVKLARSARMEIVQLKNRKDLESVGDLGFLHGELEGQRERLAGILQRVQGTDPERDYWDADPQSGTYGEVQEKIAKADHDFLQQLRRDRPLLEAQLSPINAAIDRVWNSDPLARARVHVTPGELRDPGALPENVGGTLRIDPRVSKFSRGLILLIAAIYGLFSALRKSPGGAIGWGLVAAAVAKPKTVERMLSGKPQEGEPELRKAQSALSSIADLKSTEVAGAEISRAVEEAFKPAHEEAREKLQEAWKDGLTDEELRDHPLFRSTGVFKGLGEVLAKVKGESPENRAERRRVILSALYRLEDDREAMRHVLESIKGWGA